MQSSFLGNYCDKARASGQFVPGLCSLYTRFAVSRGDAAGGGQSGRREGRQTGSGAGGSGK